MKRSSMFYGAGLALALATPAVAGNLSEPVVETAPAPVAMTPAPVSFGSDWTGFYAGGSLGYAGVTDDDDVFASDFEGLTYGVHAGYDYDFGSFVLGGELEISGFDLSDSNTGTDVDSVTRLKLRAGYDAGNFLPYIAAGAAQLNTSSGVLGSESDTGYFYGAGVDYRLGNGMRVGAEVLQHEFDDYAGSGIDADALTGNLRVSFEF